MSKKTDLAEFLNHIDAIDSIDSGLNDIQAKATHLEELSSPSFLNTEQMTALQDLVQLVDDANEKMYAIKYLFANEIDAAEKQG